jgi:hypothetical protein
MTLKIERITAGREKRVRLSGQLRSEHLGELEAELERGESRVALDLEEVDLVDVQGVRFLNECEDAGIPVLHCSTYIRAWMLRERGRPKKHPEPL